LRWAAANNDNDGEEDEEVEDEEEEDEEEDEEVEGEDEDVNSLSAESLCAESLCAMRNQKVNNNNSRAKDCMCMFHSLFFCDTSVDLHR
jgi:hypothetical protein